MVKWQDVVGLHILPHTGCLAKRNEGGAVLGRHDGRRNAKDVSSTASIPDAPLILVEPKDVPAEVMQANASPVSRIWRRVSARQQTLSLVLAG